MNFMRPPLTLLLSAFITLTCTHSFAQRQTVELPDGWKFIKHDAAPDATVSDEWQPVHVPHCWNALDGQNGKAADPGVKGGYYRGPAWYERALEIPADWKGKRVFIRFGAAFLMADVYLNGEHLGQHRGGFAAFCYELTPHLRFGAYNELRVRLDNARNEEIAPLSADFTMEGGLYRPVSLLVTGQECITPLDFGGPGVYATPTNVSANGADVEVETKLEPYNGPVPGGLPSEVRVEIRDAQGNRVSQGGSVLQQQGLHPGINTSVKQRFHLDHPHLWNGIKDPYTYTVNVRLTRNGAVLDEVNQPLGFRTVEIDQEKGFLLNGQPYKIYGVNRHQEKRNQGWALSDADQDADFQTIREMGATAVRLAHYQQAGHVHDLCDKNGILLWQEIPLVNEIGPSDAFADNAKQQLTEMIRQCSNHPSIMTWSMFNELYNAKTPPVEPLVTTLLALAHELDPTRTPGGVSCRTDKPDLDHLPAWIGFNTYPGWYGKNPDQFPQEVKRAFDAAGGNRRIAITEYGAGANPAQHQEGKLVQAKPGGSFHPEEWQAHVHERAWALMKDDPHLWGTFVWAMFDFASDGRNEGSNPGVNDKGLVTEDRKIKKDAFYFYKANWNPEPMVYLTSRRSTPRTEAQTEVKAYSNGGEVTLTVNGQTVGAAKPDDVHICHWPNVTLKPGKNQVEVVARANGKELRDGCEWTLEAAAPVPGAPPVSAHP